MSWLELLLWLLLTLLGFAGSALFSGMETGAYSLNRVRLQIYHHQNIRSALTLRRLIDNPTSLLTTLLIGNNITNYLGTASVSVLLESAQFTEWQTIALNTLIMAPLLFVFGETLPKDLFAAYSDRLMYRLAWLLRSCQRLFTWIGLVPLIGTFTHLVMVTLGQKGRVQPFHPRRQVQVLVKEGVGYGLLSDDQSAIIERVLELGNRKVGDEMVPWREVVSVKVTDEPAVLWQLADRSSRSQFPVLDEQGRPLGVVNVMDALLHEPAQCPPIRELMKPVLRLARNMPLRRGLSELQQHEVPMAVVVDAHNNVAGIATMKDFVEAITGELASW